MKFSQAKKHTQKLTNNSMLNEMNSHCISLDLFVNYIFVKIF